MEENHVAFISNPDFSGWASFQYTVTDDGITNNSPKPESATAQARFYVGDTEAPVTTLFGDNPAYILKGQTYSETGFMADDNEDGDLTGEVSVDGSVNHDRLGDYVLRYNVSDSSGNAATE
ncbi:DUF5011 domain-containing protein [Brevibacillus composti]|uniref:DUF5011 domain-containing protein n=2 Tax=Brevibacillus composti TaxID=2796470 RepID=A0A7T5JQT0_9BACL|nr:DUF5011 domain-containing protein [Brevibacillus composti]QUO43573.1 DUF5011 domain-containing protein [Brevibacillus composti]